MRQMLTFIVLLVAILGCSATDPNQRHFCIMQLHDAFSGLSGLGVVLSLQHNNLTNLTV